MKSNYDRISTLQVATIIALYASALGYCPVDYLSIGHETLAVIAITWLAFLDMMRIFSNELQKKQQEIYIEEDDKWLL